MANKKMPILLCTVSTLLSYKLATAILADRFAATWNLKGDFASSEDKWSINVGSIFVNPNSPTVIAVQEAGPVPSLAERQGDLGDRLINPENLYQEVIEYRWDIGSAYLPDIRWVYYTQNDEGANVAFCTNVIPDSVIILRPHGSQKLVLGIQLKKDIYFSVHASESGSGKAVSTIETILNFITSNQLYDYQFMIMGEFNMNPDDLRIALELEQPDILRQIGIYHPYDATHNCDITDYALIGQDGYDLPNHLSVEVKEPQLEGISKAKHQPLLFYVTQN